MRTLYRFAFMVAILFAFGCSSNNKGKIEGTKWSSMAATVKNQNVPAGALSLEFATDGSVIYNAGPMRYTGKYSLGMGDNVTLNLDQELAGSKKHLEKVKIEGDTLTMIDGDGTKLSFSKVTK
jgi:hypothetical protein